MGNNVLQFPATVARRRKSRKPLEPGSRAHRCQPRTNSTASGSRQPGVAHGHPPSGSEAVPSRVRLQVALYPEQLAGSPRAGARCRQAGRQASWGEVAPTGRKFRQVPGLAAGTEPAAAAAAAEQQQHGGLPAPGTPRAARRRQQAWRKGGRPPARPPGRPPTPPRARPRRPGSPRAPAVPGEGRRPAPRGRGGGEGNPATLHEKMLCHPCLQHAEGEKKNVRR